MTYHARPPKKYEDVDRTLVTEAWLEWREQRRREISRDFDDYLQMTGMPHEDFFPEEYDKDLDEEGDWIFVTSVPYTDLEFKVPRLSIWFAKTKPGNSVVLKGTSFATQLVEIVTPTGSLKLYPHEYRVCNDIVGLMQFQGEGVTINSIGGKPILEEELVFYLQQRGIAMKKIVEMLIGEVKQQDLLYLTLDEDIAEFFAGVGVSLHQHIAENPRPKVDA